MEISWIVYSLFFLALVSSVSSWVSASCALAVFFLAALFLVVGLLFFIMGAEFLAVLLLVIYAGAIILLFLFVVFLLNLRAVELYNNFKNYLPVGVLIALLLWAILSLLAQESFLNSPGASSQGADAWQDFFFFDSNLNLFGHLLYEHFGFFTVLVAVLLLTVMSAVIIVTLSIDNKQGGRALAKKSLDLELIGKQLSVTAWAKSTPKA